MKTWQQIKEKTVRYSWNIEEMREKYPDADERDLMIRGRKYKTFRWYVTVNCFDCYVN